MKTKKDGSPRKSTKGIPRVTDKVLAMSEEDRAAWLLTVPAEHRAEVEARLETAMTEGRKPRKVDFGTVFNGRSVEELTEAQTALTNALAEAAVAEEAKLNEIIAKATAQKDALVAARESKEASETSETSETSEEAL